MTDTLLNVEIGQLMPDPTQPRKTFLKEEIERLAASIAARGVLQPLRVVRDEERKCWRIILGESRWRAAQLAGLTHVPCVPITGQATEADILSDQIVENAARNSLRPLELGRALAKLKALKGCTSQQLAIELGMSGASITRAEALLSLPTDVQALVDCGKIPESSAYEISRLPDETAQRELAAVVAAGRASRDQVVEIVQGRLGRKSVRPRSSRVACRFSGLCLTVSAAEPLTWESLLATLDAARKAARRLCDDGKDVTELAKVLKG
jgi:ParB family chromosome partitioning protein